MKINENDLTSLGLKNTKQRHAILTTLKEKKSPSDVAEILEYLQKNKVTADQATIYRILDTFHKKGLVSKIDLGEGKLRYELAGDDHHHIVCEKCGKIEDVSDCSLDRIQKEISHKKGFIVKRHSLEFYGLCPDCKNK